MEKITSCFGFRDTSSSHETMDEFSPLNDYPSAKRLDDESGYYPTHGESSCCNNFQFGIRLAGVAGLMVLGGGLAGVIVSGFLGIAGVVIESTLVTGLATKFFLVGGGTMAGGSAVTTTSVCVLKCVECSTQEQSSSPNNS